MDNQDYFDIVANSRKEFLKWLKENFDGFKSLQHIFPEDDNEIEIQNILFYNNEEEIIKYNNDGTTNLIIAKFKEVLKLKGLPKNVIDVMSFEIDSDENVQLNYEGNYFNRINK